MRININETELKERIELNFNRLSNDKYYMIDEVFPPADYDWYGDKEGRALLAFVSHYKMSGRKIPCMEEMMALMPEKINSKGYIGEIFDDIIHEQQLSGHSWLLRGLCEYYEAFDDNRALEHINNVVENLYLPLLGKINTYPVDREASKVGDVSGESLGNINGWVLSSDVGCAFMSIDGLSHAYEVTKNDKVKELLDEMIEIYLSIDKLKLRVQTHCTLTSARGMMRMYSVTQEKKYLDGAKTIFDLYVNHGGMSYTYHNLNWWGRPDSWSEPCAIVDSVMLGSEIFKATKDEMTRKVTARIYHNAVKSMQRDNGGAGPDTLVCEGGVDYLGVSMFEAEFCCSMRLAEGLWYIKENSDSLYAETAGKLTKNENNIYFDGDIIYGEVEDKYLEYAETVVECDGHKLCPILPFWKIPRDVAQNIKMQIVFN